MSAISDVMDRTAKFIDDIKSALGTDEDDPAAIIEIARNAHRAEQKLATMCPYCDCTGRCLGTKFEMGKK